VLYISNKKKIDKNGIKRKLLVQALELPADIVLDLPNITLLGDEELHIAGHAGLLEYAAGHIKIKTKSSSVVKVFGSNFIIKEIGAENIVVSGKIDKLGFD